MKIRLFYLWFLPLLWGIFTTISFFHSGDEHALFAYGSLAGTWTCFLYEFKTLEQALIPVLATGAVILALTGLLSDWLRVKKRLWLSVFVLIAVLVFIFQFRMYGSIERIRGKHGSVLSLVIVACNWGIYGAIMFSVFVTLLGRLIGLVRRAPVNKTRSRLERVMANYNALLKRDAQKKAVLEKLRKDEITVAEARDRLEKLSGD